MYAACVIRVFVHEVKGGSAREKVVPFNVPNHLAKLVKVDCPIFVIIVPEWCCARKTNEAVRIVKETGAAAGEGTTSYTDNRFMAVEKDFATHVSELNIYIYKSSEQRTCRTCR